VYRRIQYVVTVLRGIIEITYLLTMRPIFSAIYRVVVINYDHLKFSIAVLYVENDRRMVGIINCRKEEQNKDKWRTASQDALVFISTGNTEEGEDFFLWLDRLSGPRLLRTCDRTYGETST
jgi:hypothetical protein